MNENQNQTNNGHGDLMRNLELEIKKLKNEINDKDQIIKSYESRIKVQLKLIESNEQQNDELLQELKVLEVEHGKLKMEIKMILNQQKIELIPCQIFNRLLNEEKSMVYF